MTSSRRAAAIAARAVVLGLVAGAAGCFDTPKPSCAFLCGDDLSCPSGYTCATDGWCKLDSVPDTFVCDGVAIDAPQADAGLDAPADAAIDAPEPDAAVDAEPDADIDAPTDAAIDASPAMLTIITASPLSFGTVVQTQSATRVVTLRNSGGTVTSAVSLGVTGDAAYALVADASDTCSGNPLLPGTNCTFTLRYTPTGVGTATGVASAMATEGGTVSINLTGSSTPALTAPATLAFGDVMAGMSSSLMLTFTNAGTVTTGTLTTTAPANPLFTITADGCDATTVVAAGTCQLTVRFAPTATGAEAATVTVDGTPGGPRTVMLTGTGI